MFAELANGQSVGGHTAPTGQLDIICTIPISHQKQHIVASPPRDGFT
jgi:hypothetical protein